MQTQETLETNRIVLLVLIDSAIDGMKDRSLISTSEMIDLLLDMRGLTCGNSSATARV